MFDNPLWPFTSAIDVPRVALDSARLVQRHINSLCLGAFLDDRDIRRLKTGWFFQDDGSGSSPGRQFIEWCRAGAEEDERLNVGLRWLIKGTALAASAPANLQAGAAEALARSMDAWQREVALCARMRISSETEDRRHVLTAVLAIERQLRRLEDEFLLSELANRTVSPWPRISHRRRQLHSNDNDELKRQQAARKGREESLGKRLGYPSRQMEMAIREYAPGAEIVMDGRVYESAGVTLNPDIARKEDRLTP